MKKLLTFLLLVFSLVCSGQGDADSLETLVRKNSLDIPTARAYNILASKYARTDPPKSMEYASRALAMAKVLNHELTQSASLSIFVSYFQNAGFLDSARFYLNELEKLAAASSGEDGDVVKGNFNSTAGLYHKRTGDLKKALPHFRASIYHLEKAEKGRPDRSVSVAGQSLNLANTYVSLGNYKNALEFYFKALEKFEAIGNQDGISFCLQGIGNCFVELKQYDRAKVYLNRSFKMKQDAGDKKGLATAYLNLGKVSADQDEYNSAISYFLKALEYAKELNLVTEEQKITYNLGRVYKDLGDLKNAEKYLSHARTLAVRSGDQVTLSATDMELVSLKDSKKSEDSTEKVLQSNVARVETLGFADQTLSGYQHLAKFYMDNGDFEKAYYSRQNYYDLRDSLKGNELLVMLRNMEEKFNSEKKEKEIAQLKRDQVIAEAQIKEQRLMQYSLIFIFGVAALVGFLLWNRYKLISHSKRQAELEQVRNNIARDLHDDIGSTLSSINILSKVMLDSSHTVNINGLQKIKEHSGNIMESMGDIVWAINPTNDTFEKLIARMKEFASEILDPLNVRYEFRIDSSLTSMKIDPARKKDIFLIFKETINNAAKYSQCDEIIVSITQFQKQITISISDNGKGMEEVSMKGNGLRNIHTRASALAGDAEIKSVVGKGTEVKVKLPVT